MTDFQRRINNRIEQGFHLLPDHMIGGMRNYIVHGIMPGGFLTAVLQNEFMEAAHRADSINSTKLRDYAIFLYNYAPKDCYGSREATVKWSEQMQQEGGLK